jgi:Asp/Glu/hydantoin racemase
VIEGVAAAVVLASGLVAMGLGTSRANTYAEVSGFAEFELRDPGR